MGFREELDVPDSMRERRPFGRGALRGVAGAFLSDRHRLSGQVESDYRAGMDSGEIVYTVYSHATPIGWVLSDGSAVVPDVEYSNTTRAHQRLVREHL